MSDLDVQQLAADLAKATAAFDRIVTNRANDIANKLAVGYAKAAQDKIDAAEADAQRWKDLNEELWRQHAPLERAAATGNRLATAIRRAHYAGDTTIDVAALLDIINARNAEAADA